MRTELQAFIDHLREINRAQKALQGEIPNYSRKVAEICTKHLKVFGVKFYADLTGGSGVPDWSPYVLIGDIMGRNGSHTYAKIDGKWVWYEGHLGCDVYAHKVKPNHARAPIDGAALEAACAKLSEEIGIPVKIVSYETKKPDRLRNTDDLLATFPGSTVLASGAISFMGWDITDPWTVIQAHDGKHVFFATNGHGFGYDVHIKPGEDLTPFLNLTQEEGFDNVELARRAVS